MSMLCDGGDRCPVSAPPELHGAPGARSTCKSCGYSIMVSADGHWFHLGTGVTGWVDDPTDAAHRAIPS